MTSVAQSATDVDEGRLDSAHAPAVRWGGTRARLELLHGLYILATLAVIIEATGAAPSLGASVALAALWATAQPITRAVFARRPYQGPFIVAASASLLGLVLASLAGFWFQGLEGHGDNLLMVAAFAFVVSATAQALLRWNVGPRRLLLAGTGNGGAELATELERRPELRYVCIGSVSDADSGSCRWLGPTSELGAIVAREQPDYVVVAETGERDAAVDQLLDVRSPRFRIVPLSHFYEYAFGRVPVSHVSSSWFMSLLHLYQRPYPRIVKRALDVTLAGIALVLAAPLMLAIAFAVRRSGPGPILFRQVRLGQGGEPFEILKFRTMVDGAEEAGRAVWAGVDDARVTRIGRRLRKWRLDELPQLWNVLRGEMSVVGPRPERPEFLERLQREVPFWSRRHLAKPGLTGWAQVRRGYAADLGSAADKLSYDLYYLKHQSLVLDLAIAFRTARIVVSGSGAR